MRTPAGKECKYFYGNYFRGKNVEECRLIGHRPPPGHWTPDLCSNCPLPDILWANSCSNIVLTGQAIRKFPFIKRKVVVLSLIHISEPTRPY